MRQLNECTGFGMSGLQAFGAANGGRVEPQRRGQPATRRGQRRPTKGASKLRRRAGSRRRPRVAAQDPHRHKGVQPMSRLPGTVAFRIASGSPDHARPQRRPRGGTGGITADRAMDLTPYQLTRIRSAACS
jgi:hypothetical protein